MNLNAFSKWEAFRAYWTADEGCLATPGRADMKLQAFDGEVGDLTKVSGAIVSEEKDEMLEEESKLPTDEPQEGRLEVGDEVADRLRSQL